MTHEHEEELTIEELRQESIEEAMQSQESLAEELTIEEDIALWLDSLEEVTEQSMAAGPATEEQGSPELTRAPSQFLQGRSGVRAAKVLRAYGGWLCPALLDWNDWLPAVAISRSAMCAKHLQLARLSRRTERRLLRRGFGPVLRPPLHTPAVVDVLACALAR